MTAGAEDTPRDPSAVLRDLRAKSNLIVHQRSRRDDGKFRSVGDALGLQRLERDRERLMGELPPLRLVTE